MTKFLIFAHNAKIGIAFRTLPPAKQVDFQEKLKNLITLISKYRRTYPVFLLKDFREITVTG